MESRRNWKKGYEKENAELGMRNLWEPVELKARENWRDEKAKRENR
jgi:hypothetical protein